MTREGGEEQVDNGALRKTCACFILFLGRSAWSVTEGCSGW